MPLNVSAVLASVYVGLQGLLVTGTHTDIAGAQHGVAAGALIQVGVRGHRVGLRLEGVPPVSLPQKPSVTYGAATPQLSLINGAVRYAVDPAARVWVGAGETIINQRTPLPNLSQLVASRLAGVRYEVEYRAPIGNSHFIEFVFGAAPHLTGSDIYTFSVPHEPVVKPEIAAEEDAMIATGITRPNSELLLGLRSINFSARFVLTGEAGDRNNGGGVIVEWRRFINK